MEKETWFVGDWMIDAAVTDIKAETTDEELEDYADDSIEYAREENIEVEGDIRDWLENYRNEKKKGRRMEEMSRLWRPGRRKLLSYARVEGRGLLS